MEKKKAAKVTVTLYQPNCKSIDLLQSIIRLSELSQKYVNLRQIKVSSQSYYYCYNSQDVKSKYDDYFQCVITL